MSAQPPAKFFVNSGVVSGREDMHNLVRPLLKQTVTYRYYRGGALVSQGTGWVERIVTGEAGTSTYFTPLSICLNLDSFEHLEFETGVDQLIAYTFVQGNERVRVEYASGASAAAGPAPVQQAFDFPPVDYVQMEFGGLEGEADNAGQSFPNEEAGAGG